MPDHNGTPTWRQFADRLTPEQLEVFENSAAIHGDDDPDLLDIVHDYLSDNDFQDQCNAARRSSSVPEMADACETSRWWPPEFNADDRHPVTYRQIVIRRAEVADLIVEVCVDELLDGTVPRAPWVAVEALGTPTVELSATSAAELAREIAAASALCVGMGGVR